MSPVLTSPVMIVNDALVRLGVKQRIGNLFDGSAASKAALDIYGQTRDQQLRAGEWGFARRDVSMTLLKSAPTSGYSGDWNPTEYPPLPWRFAYEYPDDCLKVRAIRPPLIFLPDFDPQPIVYDTPNVPTDDDPPSTVKVIVCNVEDAILTYTGQVTDPTLWETTFVEAFSASLARRLAEVIASGKLQFEAADEQLEGAQARMTQG